MYEHHFGNVPPVAPDDVHLLDVSSVPTTVLATASFPCNDLSLAGARRGFCLS
jgi:DNA (cytosine-5)-methyltransferase 1